MCVSVNHMYLQFPLPRVRTCSGAVGVCWALKATGRPLRKHKVFVFVLTKRQRCPSFSSAPDIRKHTL